MRYDFRPYYLKRLHLRLQRLYVNHFLRPQLESLGRQFNFMRPWHVEIFGPNIHLGNHVTVIATPDNRVRFSVWPESKDTQGIFVGDACLICPGVRISAARKITIGDGSMLASGAYLSDADWHDIYNRVSMGAAAPITLGKNVWVCDNAIVCKGVTVGDNSVIGARSVVIGDVPENVVVAGNPAKIVKKLDPEKGFFTRTEWLQNYRTVYQGFAAIDRHVLKDNTLRKWLRHRLFPGKGE